MRIHAIHVQGLLRPRGVHRLKLDSGYALLVARDPEDCAGFRATLESLLYPDSCAAALDRWVDRAADPAPRAGLSLTLGADTLRVISDVAAGRIHLGRFDPEERRYVRVSNDPVEIEEVPQQPPSQQPPDRALSTAHEPGQMDLTTAPGELARDRVAHRSTASSSRAGTSLAASTMAFARW